MLNRILTKELIAERRKKNRAGILSGLYNGRIGTDGSELFADKDGGVVKNTKGERMESLVVAKDTGPWINSEGYGNLWDRIETEWKKIRAKGPQNVSQFPDDYYTLRDMIRQDLTRRRIEEADFTDMIAQEITNLAFGRSVRLDEFIPFTGAFLEIAGRGESVPMIQQKTGATDTTLMHIYGLGHERSLEDELYNLDIFTLQKVNEAVTRAFTGVRNGLTIGQLVAYNIAGTWAANQRVAAVNTGNYELDLYNTIHRALRRLYGLLDPQTLQEISASRIALIVGNNVIAWDLNRVLNGQLSIAREGTAGAGSASIQSVAALPIDEIWQYKGDTLYLGPDKVVYPGVPDGHAYLVVTAASDNANFVLTKRGLTSEIGRGDVLTFAREKRAWYFVQSEYNKEFFGETGGCTAGSGFCVEITLPTYDET